MHRGFKVNITRIDSSTLSSSTYQKIGTTLYDSDRKETMNNLSQYILSNNFLNGNGLQKVWFPQIKADIFISHSHKDKNMALALSGWLFKNFKIKSFVDSCVWLYGDDLLKKIDNQFCRNENGINYNYEKRNLSTAHVHLMMASAISSMIDRTECLFFLNSPNSISYTSGNTETDSPWLYFEIGQSQIVRRKFPGRKLYENQRYFSESGVFEKSLGLTYKVDLSHFSEITNDSLEDWYDESCSDEDPGKSLDALYTLVLAKRISDQLNG